MKLKGVEQVLRAIANEYVIAVEGNNLVARDPSRTRHDPRGENISMMRNKPGNREKMEASLNGRRVPTGTFARIGRTSGHVIL